MRKQGPAFVPAIYKLATARNSHSASLEIQGQKSGPPNKRIILNQKGLKVIGAKITYLQKNKKIEHHVTRINHLPAREEVRLHTDSPLYPGSYQIEVEFRPADINALTKLSGERLEDLSLREIMPSFDTKEARQDVAFEIAG